MSLLTPIITQMELDRDRLRDLVNGDVDATVELEERTEKSIAGQVQDRIDGLAVDLSTSVQLAQQARDEAQQARADTQTLKSSTETLRDHARDARDEAVNASQGVSSARDQAISAADAASLSAASAAQEVSQVEDARDGAVAARNEAEGFRDASQAARNEAEGFRDASEAARDQSISARDAAVTAQNASEGFRDEAEVFRNQALEAGIVAGFIPRYEVNSVEIDQLDQKLSIEDSTVFRIDGSQNWNLTLPSSTDFSFEDGRAQTVIVFVEDSGGDITWPEEISWAGGNEPVLGTSWTNIVLFWTGSMWIGMESAKR